ncbi:MAG: transcriptional repressor LexA [Acidobacteriota bacterium]|nr:transcriptional repressor LexA [Acidobacteriota bacterium]MXW71887.1 repressor LexA [Acidobacteriota bacterium]MXX86816.1 repressor LexA [Acidobacteriota bacterium]MYE44010.1 repressor LexA [Acidobacteriota bacterium]MYG74600.1 repressor LexA [Acidobacteriota bacterium]
MPKTPPGQTRNRVFRFVRDRLLRGDSPSLREVQQHFGFRAVETVRAHLTALVEEGRLVKEPGRARGYRLPKRQPKRLSAPVPDWSSGRLQPVPLLGEVAAGGFEEAIENPEGNLPVEIPDSRDLSDYFALRVRGESMSGAGILPGDTVIVERRGKPVSGQIVVALLEEDATVKRLHLGQHGMELRPENPDFDTLRPPPGSCRILGRVVELRRQIR